MATLSMFSGIIIKKYWACLKSPAYFRQVKAEYGMLCWPNDIDIAPEDVWEDAVRCPKGR